jgi:hypothetical protein
VKYRLLFDLEAVTFLDSLPARVRSRLLFHFINLRATPDRYSDYHENDATGRRIEISVFAGYSVHYWIDFADRHVKVLAVKFADRPI